jgi:hypothetical protein
MHTLTFITLLLSLFVSQTSIHANTYARARYTWADTNPPPASTVATFQIALSDDAPDKTWLYLHATKANQDTFQIWLCSNEYPTANFKDASIQVLRYLLQENSQPPVEYRNQHSNRATLPYSGNWPHLLPRQPDGSAPLNRTSPPAPTVSYLGHTYSLTPTLFSPPRPPNNPTVLQLTPDLLVGFPHNTRQINPTRRYDDSDYELTPLTPENYLEMIEAGMNCLNVNAEQLAWIQNQPVFYWGISPAELPYPECLYRSTYLGPTLFLDEPAVCTRDHVIRPKLREDDSFRSSITPQTVLAAFTNYFHHDSLERSAWNLQRSLANRPDISLGSMSLPQANLYSWETMISSAAYQLSQHPTTPAAIVFEPPGRIGTLRTLPEINMTYNCQIPANNPNHLLSILTGFLRGAARATDKTWGISIYGSVDRADAPYWFTHAYDLGATRFFFWDSYRLACVPYPECLDIARNLKKHTENLPHRNLHRLTHAAETAILIPPGYNLGHVYLGRGLLWGLPELNLERTNSQGIPYRTVMHNAFIEIERCLRLGTTFDLLWDLPSLQPNGYREIVRIRENGQLDVSTEQGTTTLNQPRTPTRPDGQSPTLKVQVTQPNASIPCTITATAEITETSTPVYYTHGTDHAGVYHNAAVAHELYGPKPEDYRFLQPTANQPNTTETPNGYQNTTQFTLTQPGTYTLRTSTTDLAGRTTTIWTTITTQ